MDKAYIILAHKNIEQLNRLLARLDDNNSYFFLHIDSKLDDGEFAKLRVNEERTQVLRRIDTKWADFSLVQATINALQAVKATQREFRAITLLSGEDYPIKSNEQISEFFANDEHGIFMEHFELPNHEKWSPRGGMYRIDKYFFGLKEYQLFGSRTVNFLGNIIPAFKRSQPQDIRHYAGSQWWTIDMYALHYILDFVKASPAYSSFHKATFAPDEIFFQTILLNASDPRIKASMTNNNKRFIRWRTSSMSHPEYLQDEDLRDIRQSDALFARKLDMEHSDSLFDLIDQECLNDKTVAA